MTALRILVVEDEALIALLLDDELVELGHEVVGIADTAGEAIALAGSLRPDIVFCDVKLLNGDSGLDVAAALGPLGIPCMLLSGNCPGPEEAGRIALGCLKKPFNPDHLAAAIATALRLVAGEPAGPLPSGMVVY